MLELSIERCGRKDAVGVLRWYMLVRHDVHRPQSRIFPAESRHGLQIRMRLISEPLGYSLNPLVRTGVTGALCSALMPTKYINRSFACSVLRLPVSIKLAIVCFYIDTQDANEEDQVAKPLVPPPLLP
jgi:hypothetical protein